MSEVKRYDPNYDVISPEDDSMVLTHDGLFVEASDYDQLKAANVDLQLHFDTLKSDYDQLKAELDDPFRLARHSKRLVEQLRADNEKLKAEKERLREAAEQIISEVEKRDVLLFKLWRRSFEEAIERDQLKAENERIDREAGETIAALTAQRDTLRIQLDDARELLTRYRKETPIGYQPHMIAHIADAWLEANHK